MAIPLFKFEVNYTDGSKLSVIWHDDDTFAITDLPPSTTVDRITAGTLLMQEVIGSCKKFQVNSVECVKL